jgi:hypothetical protein
MSVGVSVGQRMAAWFDAANHGDAEAALALGRWALHPPEGVEGSLDKARRWLDLAGALGDASVRRRVADLAFTTGSVSDLEQARWSMTAWGRSLLDDYPAGGPIEVDPGTFAPTFYRDGRFQGPDFTVGIDTPAFFQATTVLIASLDRCLRVTGAGVELTLREIADGADDTTCPRVGNGPSVVNGVATLWFECGRDSTPDMGRTMLAIVVEEMRRAGLTGRVRPRVPDQPFGRSLTLPWDAGSHSYALLTV